MKIQNRHPVAVEDFTVRAHDIWAHRWFLLCSGDYAAGAFNMMTVAWGSFGTIWFKPFVQVVVRPGRYTFEFMERYDTFTLCAFPESCRKALEFCGSRSGRQSDKVAETGLSPEPAQAAAAPVFKEADLAIECRKIYWHDIDPAHFLDPSIDTHYPQRDYHRAYFGEILCVTTA